MRRAILIDRAAIQRETSEADAEIERSESKTRDDLVAEWRKKAK